jgi:hypothetical protein
MFDADGESGGSTVVAAEGDAHTSVLAPRR